MDLKHKGEEFVVDVTFIKCTKVVYYADFVCFNLIYLYIYEHQDIVSGPDADK